jgi:hypothetical protein
MAIERRNYVRFFAHDNAFAALRVGFKKVGKIHDISIKGLAFSYLRETTESDFDGHNLQVDIFFSGNGFYLSHLPCRIVYDFVDSSSDKGFFVKMSRCGLYFGELNENQLDKLNFFIKNHTIRV